MDMLAPTALLFHKQNRSTIDHGSRGFRRLMSIDCKQCGTLLTEADVFCTRCGARQGHIAKPDPPESFCTNCGERLAGETKFCTKCGIPSGAVPTQAAASIVSNQPPSQFAKLLIAGVVIVVLFLAAIAAGVIYIAHRAKQKSAEIEAAYGNQNNGSKKPDTNENQGSPSGTSSEGTPDNAAPNGNPDLSGAFGQLLNKLGAGTNSGTQPQPNTNPNADLSDVPGSFAPGTKMTEPCPDAVRVTVSGKETAKVPLRPGLTWVNAWHRFNGDVEIINKVEGIAANEVITSNSGLGFTAGDSVNGIEVNATRHVCRVDLQSAEVYITDGDATLPPTLPQTTNFSMSQKSLQTLKTTGKVTLGYQEFEYFSGRMVPVPRTAELTRVEPEDINYPVILNGQPTSLSVIHARGHFKFSGSDKVRQLYKERDSLSELEGDGEILVLDDSVNPMMLQFGFGPVFRMRVIKITFPEEKPKPQIEQQLEKQKKAIVYGIYFDFNQASIKKESQPVLKEIADAMRNNPDWNLTVNGYTDNIGGDAYNVDLSKRRAAAVKDALLQQYSIASSRLTTGGFGASTPVDTNETLEGRARNRRVELIRQ